VIPVGELQADPADAGIMNHKALRDGIIRPLGIVGRATLIGLAEDEMDDLKRTSSQSGARSIRAAFPMSAARTLGVSEMARADTGSSISQRVAEAHPDPDSEFWPLYAR